MRGGVLWGAISALALAPAVHAAPSAGRPDLDQLAGVYRHRFTNQVASEGTVQSEDILEVVKLPPGTAYFRIHTEAPGNGHICALWGVADLEADALVYRGAAGADGPCVLKFRSDGRRVALDDVGQHCSRSNCGAGSSFNNAVDFTFARKRPIRYMARLRQSRQYAEAVKAHGGTEGGQR